MLSRSRRPARVAEASGSLLGPPALALELPVVVLVVDVCPADVPVPATPIIARDARLTMLPCLRSFIRRDAFFGKIDGGFEVREQLQAFGNAVADRAIRQLDTGLQHAPREPAQGLFRRIGVDGRKRA